METDVLLTVIVTVYNVSEWLPRCLDSILAQTYKHIEILVIDDGSTDNSPSIIDDYAEKHAKIRVIHQKNRGLVAARERGIFEAKGDYIGFVDGDDEIVPEMYNRLIANAIKYNAQISQCGIAYCYHDGRVKPVFGTGKTTVYNRYDGCFALLRGTEMEPSLCNKIYQKSILKNSCIDDTVVNNEDLLRNIVLFDRANKSVLEDFCGYRYWRRADSMSTHKNPVLIGKNILRARRDILEYVPEELKAVAEENYLQGAIRTYNSIIGQKDSEANDLRKTCRRIMRDFGYKRKDVYLSIRVTTILLLPFLYDRVERIHLRIRNQRKNNNKMN